MDTEAAASDGASAPWGRYGPGVMGSPAHGHGRRQSPTFTLLADDPGAQGRRGLLSHGLAIDGLDPERRGHQRLRVGMTRVIEDGVRRPALDH